MPNSIIPRPSLITLGDGYFVLSEATTLRSDSEVGAAALSWFRGTVYELTGVALESGESSNVIRLVEQRELTSESYLLQIAPTGIEIRASDFKGFLYGLVSLLQLVLFAAPQSAGLWTISAQLVEDSPRFDWRGLMLDSSRHFQPVSWIKKFLDLMVLHKCNVFHWHLTDDQGWRAEIKRFPALTTVGAWRSGTRLGHETQASDGAYDDKPHGGFYSQDQMREIVEYAQARGITVVPEIEMPGHAAEVLAAYPHLGCTGEPCEVSRHWGVHDEVFCAGNDEVLRFLEGVLEEILEIFPSQFIHLGGDECLGTRWKDCPKCQQRMRDEGLEDERGLQSWFVRHFDTFLRKRGRNFIGWDEILEGDLTSNVLVMSWRGEEGGITAVHRGHDVVMAPEQWVYLDRYQSSEIRAEPLAFGGLTTLKHIYKYEPIPVALSEEQASHVLGGQGNIWTEYMPRPDQIEYMAFPRACALAEKLWSARENCSYPDFVARLKPHLRLLDRLHVNYRPPKADDLA